MGEVPAACRPVWVPRAWPYLQCYGRVLQAVDPEAVLQRGAEGGGEDGQLEPLDCQARVGLTREDVGAQLVQQDVAGPGLQLAVAGGVKGLLIQGDHLLQGDSGGEVAVPAKALERVQAGWVSRPGPPAPQPWLLTSQWPWWAWVLSWKIQSPALTSAQCGTVRMTGRHSRRPVGPQVTEGLNTVWVPSESGLGWDGGQEGGSEGAVLASRLCPSSWDGRRQDCALGAPRGHGLRKNGTGLEIVSKFLLLLCNILKARSLLPFSKVLHSRDVVDRCC